MTDVRFYQTTDGGDIIEENGVIELTNEPDTEWYLSLFGGNADGSKWWDGSEASNTIKLLAAGTPLNSYTLPDIKEAVVKDLPDASSVEVRITGPKNLQIVANGTIIYDGPWEV